MEYKNYIFDFGNVLYYFKPEDIIAKYTDNKKEVDLIMEILFSGWKKLDEGSIDYYEYINGSVEKAPKNLKQTVETILRTWHRAIPQVGGMIDVLKELKDKNKKLFLLSNAPTFLDEVKDSYPEIEFFDKIIISGVVKMVKPNIEIYEYALKEFDIDPKDTIFIDDRQENIEGAKKVGLSVYLFDGDTQKLRESLGIK